MCFLKKLSPSVEPSVICLNEAVVAHKRFTSLGGFRGRTSAITSFAHTSWNGRLLLNFAGMGPVLLKTQKFLSGCV